MVSEQWLVVKNSENLFQLGLLPATDHRPLTTASMVGAAGIEPATTGLENRCSIQLSYAPLRKIYHNLPDHRVLRPRHTAL